MDDLSPDVMRQAIERWLDARDHFHGGKNGIGILDTYWDADRSLLAAFADGWQSDEILLTDAYHHFRKTLIDDHERKDICWRRTDLLT